MPVKKVFWDDPYQTRLTTTVTGVDGCRITLKETIFFAFSGGQQSDDGTIGGYKVAKAEKIGKEIYYFLPENHTIKVGDSVEVVIDWSTRYRLMKLHFAAELVLAIVNKRYGSPQKIGANISTDKARIDFVWSGSIAPILPEVEETVNELIRTDLAIESNFEDEAEERRYWQIKDFAKVPCGGTHLKRTGEIGAIKLKRKNIGKGRERIEISLD